MVIAEPKVIPVRMFNVQFNPTIAMINPKPMKLTKLERFVLNNADMPFDVMASQLNRTYGAMERACDRALKKTQGMTQEQIQALLGA